MKKKAQVFELQAAIIPLVVVALVITVGFLILAELSSQAVSVEVASGQNGTSGGYAFNATKTTQSALDTIPNWLPIIVIVVIGSVIIGLVSKFAQR